MWKREANRTLSGLGIRSQEEEQSKELELECHPEEVLDCSASTAHTSCLCPQGPVQMSGDCLVIAPGWGRGGGAGFSCTEARHAH